MSGSLTWARAENIPPVIRDPRSGVAAYLAKDILVHQSTEPLVGTAALYLINRRLNFHAVGCFPTLAGHEVPPSPFRRQPLRSTARPWRKRNSGPRRSRRANRQLVWHLRHRLVLGAVLRLAASLLGYRLEGFLQTVDHVLDFSPSEGGASILL